MPHISKSYMLLNRNLHTSSPGFGSSGWRWANDLALVADRHGCQDILDYGCGKFTLQPALPPQLQSNYVGYDPAILETHKTLFPADLVACLDVLEHIEPEHLQGVLDELRSLTKKAAFFVVSTRPASKNLPDGRNAHLIVETVEWWLFHILKRFELQRFIRKGDAFVVELTPGPMVK